MRGNCVFWGNAHCSVFLILWWRFYILTVRPRQSKDTGSRVISNRVKKVKTSYRERQFNDMNMVIPCPWSLESWKTVQRIGDNMPLIYIYMIIYVYDTSMASKHVDEHSFYDPRLQYVLLPSLWSPNFLFYSSSSYTSSCDKRENI